MQNCVSICEGEVSQIGHGLGSDGLEASLRGMCTHHRRTTGAHNTETHILVFCKVGGEWGGERETGVAVGVERRMHRRRGVEI